MVGVQVQHVGAGDATQAVVAHLHGGDGLAAQPQVVLRLGGLTIGGAPV